MMWETKNSDNKTYDDTLDSCLSLFRLRWAGCRRYGCPSPLTCPVILGPSGGICRPIPSQRYKLYSTHAPGRRLRKGRVFPTARRMAPLLGSESQLGISALSSH